MGILWKLVEMIEGSTEDLNRQDHYRPKSHSNHYQPRLWPDGKKLRDGQLWEIQNFAPYAFRLITPADCKDDPREIRRKLDAVTPDGWSYGVRDDRFGSEVYGGGDQIWSRVEGLYSTLEEERHVPEAVRELATQLTEQGLKVVVQTTPANWLQDYFLVAGEDWKKSPFRLYAQWGEALSSNLSDEDIVKIGDYRIAYLRLYGMTDRYHKAVGRFGSLAVNAIVAAILLCWLSGFSRFPFWDTVFVGVIFVLPFVGVAWYNDWRHRSAFYKAKRAIDPGSHLKRFI